MNLEGKVLGKRYLLIQEIGGGGMSVVYKAQCSLLKRFVAVKILRQEYTYDSEIVQRFNFEAQSAAKLQHPNIVSIFDVGEDLGYQYIVMEYVNGVTLKEYIKRKSRLVWDETLDFSIQIAAALEHAHKNMIIHRDIKPHNVIIDNQGVAKVTDFGIARASNSNVTLTDVGSTIGSVHYFSPEQARGGQIDFRSDIYSLGITMYEMLTGQIPFNADSPISVALKQINENPVPPIEINPSLPNGINLFVMKAIRKIPSDRFQSAKEMINGMYQLMKNPESFGTTETLVDENTNLKEKTKRFSVEAISNEKPDLSDTDLIRKRRKFNIILFSSVVVGGILLMLLAFYIMSGVYKPSVGHELQLKKYIGMKLDIVKASLPTWVKIEKKDSASDEFSVGQIIDQYPLEGDILKEGATSLILTVSSGKDKVTVPDLLNLNATIYMNNLTAIGLKFEEKKVFDDRVLIGDVVKIEPGSGSLVEKGTLIKVFISKGPQKVNFKLPKFIGMTYKDAKRVILEDGLSLGDITSTGGANDNFIVSGQIPEEGTDVKKGSKIDLTLDAYIFKSTELSLQGLSLPSTFSLRIDEIHSDNSPMTVPVNKIYNVIPTKVKVENIKVPINGYTTLKIYINDVFQSDVTIKPN
ncbi:MAG: Stk1 family PASTA domain-containing Ser/Thr kinase [Bacillota bacterium]